MWSFVSSWLKLLFGYDRSILKFDPYHNFRFDKFLKQTPHNDDGDWVIVQRPILFERKKIYIEDYFENEETLKYMRDKSGFEIMLPYSPKDCWYLLMYEPKLLNLNIKLKIKLLADDKYVFAYTHPLDVSTENLRIAFYNYVENNISGDYQEILPYFKNKPNEI